MRTWPFLILILLKTAHKFYDQNRTDRESTLQCSIFVKHLLLFGKLFHLHSGLDLDWHITAANVDYTAVMVEEFVLSLL